MVYCGAKHYCKHINSQKPYIAGTIYHPILQMKKVCHKKFS